MNSNSYPSYSTDSPLYNIGGLLPAITYLFHNFPLSNYVWVTGTRVSRLKTGQVRYGSFSLPLASSHLGLVTLI